VEFDSQEWVVVDGEAKVTEEEYKGKKALHLKKKEGAFIYLKDVDFTDGVIEADLSSADRKSDEGEPFVGLGFRAIDRMKLERIYFRPWYSGGPKHENTMQYSHKKSGWRELRKLPGKYETGVDIPENDWFHVKVVVSGKTLKAYVDDMETPVLDIKEMLGRESGKVGLFAYNGYFANIKITEKK